MNKLEQAARQVDKTAMRVEQDCEEALGEDGMVMVVPLDAYNDMMEAITALREAVAGDNITPTEQAEQEPIGRWNWNEAKFEWLTKFDYYKHHMTPLYAAPVRTKDLTDEELNAMWYGNTKDGWLGLFRAVIAADRELNK